MYRQGVTVNLAQCALMTTPGARVPAEDCEASASAAQLHHGRRSDAASLQWGRAQPGGVSRDSAGMWESAQGSAAVGRQLAGGPARCPVKTEPVAVDVCVPKAMQQTRPAVLFQALASCSS